MESAVDLHGYFRSGAAYRVRIALNLKGLAVRHVSHHLRKGEQRDPAFLALNPQGMVPALATDDGDVLTQSLAIIEWLEETCPVPPLLPGSPVERAQIRAFALAIACDIHPIQNLKVLKRLAGMGHGQDEIDGWMRWIIGEGFAACETMAARTAGRHVFGDAPTLADVCLVPQFANARRCGLDLAPFPRLVAIEAECTALPAFHAAAPDQQPDAE